jgi:putative phage-type endonuclease
MRVRRNCPAFDFNAATLEANWRSEATLEYKGGFWRGQEKVGKREHPILLEPDIRMSMVDCTIANHLFRMRLVDTAAKRERDDPFDRFDPAHDPLDALQRYNLVDVAIGAIVDPNERAAARARLASAEPLLREFLDDQANCSTIYGDIETTELIAHGTPLSNMEISVATLLFEEGNGAESFTLSFWGDSSLGRGAPLRFLQHALDHAKQLAFYHSRFDLGVLAAGDADAVARWARVTFDPYAELRAAYPSGVSLKLDNLLKANNLDPKTATGAEAVQMFKQGRFDALQAYNERDVRALRELVNLATIRLPNGARTTIGTLPRDKSPTTDPSALAQRSDAWFQARRGKVTASLAPSLLGVGFERRDDAFETMLTGEGPAESVDMARGRRLEDDARRFYTQVTGAVDVVETGLWIHPELGWLAASPDALVGSQGLLEIKAPKRLGPLSNAVLVQVTIQLACTRRRWCDVTQYANAQLRVQRVRFDADLFKVIVYHLRPVAEAVADARRRGLSDEDVFAPHFDRYDLEEVKGAVAETRETALGEVVLFE